MTADCEFLPAALALQASPPLPAARGMLLCICAFVAIALTWATLGHVDIVAVAHGRIVPTSRVKILQPAETAVVAAIHVTDGDAVRSGQVLIELDSTAARADLTRLRQERLALALDEARLQAQLDGMHAAATKAAPPRPAVPGASDAQRALLQARTNQALVRHRAAVATLEDERRQNEAEQAAVRQRIAQLDATVPLISERAASLRDLAARSLAPRTDYLALEEARIGQVQERAVQRAQLAVLAAAGAALAQRRVALTAQTEAEWLNALADVRTRLASYAEEIRKADRRIAQLTLRAPVAGTVQELAVHTVGGVVTPAQRLLLVVPEDDALQIEAWVPNRDIGFVRAGQAARIKIETFPFTKYGVIAGEVTRVSTDAVSDEDKGPVYAAQVAMARTVLVVDGRPVRLAPGMAVTVEVKLGERRLIEFVLGPLLRHADESMNER
ncbi:MAG: HlyD family type I secretion periplasmic adaptor subunit [Gammaproteobacteria bacterium]|nr:HlyD family type I secretion periplasmic adaptor subunit [Gammaproteobacteria bacterium]